MLTLPIREVLPATPRARIARLDLNGHAFAYTAGQAVMIGTHGGEARKAYSIASAPEDTSRYGFFELLVGLNDDGVPGPHLTLSAGALVDIEGPLGSFTFPVDPPERNFVFVAGGNVRGACFKTQTAVHAGEDLLFFAHECCCQC